MSFLLLKYFVNCKHTPSSSSYYPIIKSICGFSFTFRASCVCYLKNCVLSNCAFNQSSFSSSIYWCVLESCKWLALCNLGTKVCKTFLVRTGELFWCYSETSWISNNRIPFRRTEKQLVFWQLIFKTIGLLDTYLLSGLLYNWSFWQLVFLTTGLFDNWSICQLVFFDNV